MTDNWNTNYINPKNLIQISRGDPKRMVKYLRQFQELIPERIEKLQLDIAEKDRKKIRQTLHQMSPQLQFFEVPGVMPLILRLELEYETIPWNELITMIENILVTLNAANRDVGRVLETHFA